jgi:saccharolysin
MADLSDKIMLNWNMNPTELIDLVNEAIKQSIITNNKLAMMNLNHNNIKDFLELMENDINEFQVFHSICGFLQYISPDSNVRQASFKGDLLLTKYTNELNLRHDIYKQLRIIKEIGNLNHEDLCFVDRMILNYERNGINLGQDRRELLLKIRHEISKLENGIISSICKIEDEIIECSEANLRGIPENILNGFDRNENIYKIKTNKTNYNICMKYIIDEKIRESIELYYSNMYHNVLSYIAKIIVLRDKHAKILSYSCHGDYKAFIQMTKNSVNVKNFMAELLSKLNYRYGREVDTLKKISNNKTLYSHDISYYTSKWKQEYGINENFLKEYFEFTNTLREIFKMYEKLFNITFIKLNNSHLWHQDVTVYGIVDKNQKPIGHLYLDVYNRNSKYKQTRCFCLKQATTTQLPVVALVASIGNNKNPLLLQFQDVIGLFHELSHVMHHIFGKTKYNIFSGLNVEVDFVETPAQILDLLCWEKHIIKQLSHHYQTGESLEDQIIDKLVKLKNIDIGIYYKKHILVSLFDQIIYSSTQVIDSLEEALKTGKNENIQILLSNLYKQLNTNIMTDDKHLPNHNILLNDQIGIPYDWITTFLGSDSQYYCSIWSRVLSADIYTEKIKGQVNEQIGNELYKHIFKHGGTKPGYDMICSFMGRKPTMDGFIKMHDLDADMEYSFFLNTDQIGGSNTKNNKNNIQNTNNITSSHNNYDEVSVSNKFSEINESAICIDDIERCQTEGIRGYSRY